MDLVASLMKDVGLSDTEARVYLDGLGRGDVGVREIVRRTGIKRPTVYHALETLLQKGLVAKKSVGAKAAFTMTPPERIGALIDRRIDDLARRKEALQSVLPHLRRKHDAAVPAADVAQYDGAEGVKALVEEALYCRSGKWDIIAPRRNFFSDFDPGYAKYFMDARRRRNIVARSLWERPDAGKPTRGLSPEDLRMRQPRYLPSAMRGKFPAVVIIFDDKIALISSAKEPSGVLIRSTEMRDTFAAMFEALWATSEDYGAQMKKPRQ